MFESKQIVIVLLICLSEPMSSQNLFRGQQSSTGACDRIAARGVVDCARNFLPKNALASFIGTSLQANGGDICCSYSKYRACINGLYNGLRIAMERERCTRSYSIQIIKSMGDSYVAQSLKTACPKAGEGQSKCPKTSNQKPKRNSNSDSQRRAENRAFDSNFQPIRDIFEGSDRRDESPILKPIRDVLYRGRETIEQGTSSFGRRIQDRFNN